MSLLKAREALLERTERRYAESYVEEIGLIRIQSLSEFERAKIEKVAIETPEKLRALLIVFCLVDEEGNRLFSDEDVDAIGAIDSRTTAAVYTEIEEHLQPDADATVDEAIKN